MPARFRTVTTPLTPLALLAFCVAAAPLGHALQPGDPVRFAAKTLDDRVIKAQDYQGKLLVVHFWSTWHRPSVRQLETLRAILDHTAPLGVAMVGICLDDPNEGTVMAQTMLAGATASLTAGTTWDHVLAHAQMPALDTRFFDEAYAIPSVWVVSPDGEALWQGHPSELPEALLGFLQTHPPTALPDATLAEAQPTDDSDAQASEADPAAAREALLAEQARRAATAGQELDATAALAALATQTAAVQAARAALLEADTAWTADPPDYAGALAALATIDPASHPDPLVAAHGQRWSRVIQSLSAHAQAGLLAARDALPEAGFALDAYLAAAAAVDPMAGQPMAEASRIEPRVSRGLRDAQRERHAEAYKTFSSVLNIALGMPEADEALIHALRYEADEALMAEIAAADAESRAQAMLFLAQGHAAGFREEQAAEVLRELIAQYPDTPTAKQAQDMLDGLDLRE